MDTRKEKIIKKTLKEKEEELEKRVRESDEIELQTEKEPNSNSRKKYTSPKKQIKDALKKNKSFSNIIKIAALVLSGSITPGAIKNIQHNNQYQNVYTEELKNMNMDQISQSASTLLNTANEISQDLKNDSVEKNYIYLMNSSTKLIDELNNINQTIFKKFFESAGADTKNNKIIAITIDKKTKNSINPENEREKHSYIVCGDYYIDADGIKSAELEGNLRNLVHENQVFSEKKANNLKKALNNISEEILKYNFNKVATLDNNSNYLSLTQDELEKRITDAEKLKHNPLLNFLFGSNNSTKEHFEAIRAQKIKNIPKRSNIEIKDENDQDLYQPISSSPKAKYIDQQNDIDR